MAPLKVLHIHCADRNRQLLVHSRARACMFILPKVVEEESDLLT